MNLVTVYTQAYNSETYIKKCIESVLNQTYKNIEYILVDNGSTDSTFDIIKNYAKNDRRIKYIHFNENKSNIFIDIFNKYATGDFFTILDSDDYFEPECIQITVDFCTTNNLSAAIFGTQLYYMENSTTHDRKILSDKILSLDEFCDNLNIYYSFLRTMWGKLYKRELIKNIDLEKRKYINSLGYGLDTTTCMDMLSSCNKIGILHNILHYHLIHEKSISFVYNPSRFTSDCELFNAGYEFLKAHNKVTDAALIALSIIFVYAINETASVLLESSLSFLQKSDNLCDIIIHPYIKTIYKLFNGSSKDYNDLIDLLATYIFICSSNTPTDKAINAITCVSEMLYPNNKILSNRSVIIKLFSDKKYYTAFLSHNLEQFYDLLEPSEYLNNPILSNIKNVSFFKKNITICLDILNNNYNSALADVLNLGDNNGYNEDLIYLACTLASLTNDAATFVYAKKQECLFKIAAKDKPAATNIFNDLKEMVPNDADLEFLFAELDKL